TGISTRNAVAHNGKCAQAANEVGQTMGCPLNRAARVAAVSWLVAARGKVRCGILRQAAQRPRSLARQKARARPERMTDPLKLRIVLFMIVAGTPGRYDPSVIRMFCWESRLGATNLVEPIELIRGLPLA